MTQLDTKEKTVIEAKIIETDLDVEANKNDVQISVTYGGFWKRSIAFMIDYIVTVVLIMFFAFLGAAALALRGVDVNDTQTLLRFDLWVQASGFVLIWLYFALLESSKMQATIGKKLLGMQVTGLDGKRLSFLRSSVRHFAKILSVALALIGFIMIAFTKKKQGLHDIIASALVIT